MIVAVDMGPVGQREWEVFVQTKRFDLSSHESVFTPGVKALNSNPDPILMQGLKENPSHLSLRVNLSTTIMTHCMEDLILFYEDNSCQTVFIVQNDLLFILISK